jgi:predicted type IV restriction endonuclease
MQLSIWKRLSMKVVPSNVELEGQENNANMVTLVDLQQKVHERTKMSLSTWKHGNLYKSKEILRVHEKVQKRLEIMTILT